MFLKSKTHNTNNNNRLASTGAPGPSRLSYSHLRAAPLWARLLFARQEREREGIVPSAKKYDTSGGGQIQNKRTRLRRFADIYRASPCSAPSLPSSNRQLRPPLFPLISTGRVHGAQGDGRRHDHDAPGLVSLQFLSTSSGALI